MKSFLPVFAVIALAVSGAALADDDCHAPMSEWQSREAVATKVAELRIQTERLRIDDGCYEVRGRDIDGNRVDLLLDPASLAVLRLKVRFRSQAGVARYLPGMPENTVGSPEQAAPGERR